MFSRTIARIRSWEFLAQAISFLLVCDLLLMGPQFFRLYGVGGAIDRSILAQATDGLPLSIWPLLVWLGQVANGSNWLFGLFASTAVLAALATLLPERRWLRVLLYFVYVVLKQSIGLGTYGVHEFLQIAMFYLAIWSLFGKQEPNAQVVAFAFRVHLSVAYLFAGLSKSLGEQWWSGEATWRAMNRTEASGFRLVDLSHWVTWPWLFQALAVMTIFSEGLYPLAFIRRLRPFLVGAMIAMHFGTLVFQGLLIFGPTMIVLNVFFFLSAREWDARELVGVPGEAKAL